MIRSDTQKITCIGTPWAKLYSAKLIKDNNLLYPVGVKRNQDVVFNLYVFNEAKRVCYLPEALYNYIVWSNSAVNKYWADFSSIYLSVVNSMKVFEESINNSEERNFFENLLNQRKKYMFHETLKLQFFHPKRGIIYSENYKAFVKFLIKSDYLILLQSGNDSLTMAQKIMLLLVKLKMFRIVYLYYDVMFLYAYKKALFSR